METFFLELWQAPRPSIIPKIGWKDAVLVLTLGGLEALVFGAYIQIAQGPLPLELPLLTFSILGLIVLRRDYPLFVMVLGYLFSSGITLLATRADFIYGVESVNAELVLLFALGRWASGRKIVVGLGIALAVEFGEFILVISILAPWPNSTTSGVEFGLGFVDVVVTVFFPVLLGYGVRHVKKSHSDALEQVRRDERTDMARELHDTVAHHVAAIAVQANAGTLVAATNPGKAAERLEAISRETSLTLADMRRIVGGLRDDDGWLETSPQPEISDLFQMLSSDNSAPEIETSVAGDISTIPSSVSNGLYRIVQESITNARRHAEAPTRIVVDIVVDQESVTVSVSDDGRQMQGDVQTGFGIVGMTERALILGGTLTAGPSDGRGWIVKAKIPLGVVA